MFIGHIPAGFLISTYLNRRLAAPNSNTRIFILAGIVGAVAPDLDLLYFYLVDHGRHHHHTYFTHLPIFWAALIIAAGVWRTTRSDSCGPGLGLIFAINGFGHVVLDSIIGDVWWLAPWIDQPYSLFTIHRRLDPWWLNFLLHESFALEIALVLGAIFVWRKRRLQ